MRATHLTRATVRRTRIFSPPPPPQIAAIPPVPQVPQRFLRQRPPPGLVIPNEDPFPFEAELRPPPIAEQPFPVAAASSHHVPAMGFGGALIAGVRRFMGPRHTSERPERRNNWGVSSSFIMRWDAFEVAGGEEEAAFDGLGEAGFLDEENDSLAGGRVRNQIERAFRQRGREVRAEPDYQPEYTHPNPPSPGFTHDFSPSSSTSSVAEAGTSTTHRASGSGSRLCEATLICAACRDPLVLGASDVGEDRAKRKIWSLRCGHLLDGKCIERLIEPFIPTPEVGSSSTMQMLAEPGEHPPSPSQNTVVVGPDAGSMRSRLRPRRGMSGSFSSARHLVPATPTSARRGASLRAQSSHRINRKGKGKMKAPMIDAGHEWSCPVSGCGHVHLSLLMDGRWTMDEKRGAIAVFV